MQKIAAPLIIVTLLLSQTSFVFAQLPDATAPTTEPASTTEPAPVEETIAPPADTTGPAFISVATASAEETGVNVVWTTDELAYGFVEYGETTSYGMQTPKSASAALDHTVFVTGLTPGTEYHYRIVAEDENGNISYSKDRTFETALEVVVMDNVPPEITQVSATNITTSGATIGWITDELAQGKVEYGKTAGYDASSPLTNDYATEHSAELSSLDSNTEYHYRVVVQDESGNESISPDEIFITEPAPTTTPTEEPTVTEPEPAPPPPPPEETATSTPTTSASTPSGTATTSGTTATTIVFAISNVETQSVGTSTATIVWSTNEAATSQIFYGTADYTSSTALSAIKTTSHKVKIAGLTPGTNYIYKVVSQNASGTKAEKGGFEFNTLFQQKTAVAAPKISNISFQSIGTSTAVIIFNTNVGAAGKVNYGTTTAYGKTDGGHTMLLTNHSHPLSGLKPNTTYNFATIVRDEYGNETIYANRTFKTLADASQTVSQNITAAEDTQTLEETITDQTTETPVENSRQGGAGFYSYTPTPTLKNPKLTKVEALDGQVIFIWHPHKPPKSTSGSTQIRTNIMIARNPVAHPSSPTLGKIVYKGNAGIFTDINLENGKTYYYSVFVANQFNSYSQPSRFTVIPTKAEEEIELEAVPPVVQKNPIYVFPKALGRGDKNKHVEHLQVLLASESSLYPKGLITGYFGPLTEAAVKTFQTRHKLTATGVADKSTLKKLEKLSGIEVVKDKAAIFDAAFSRGLKPGSSGTDVSVLQHLLINFYAYPEALVTGYFGPLTQSALQTFQKEQNIDPVSGYFGPLTKKRMLNLIRLQSVSL